MLRIISKLILAGIILFVNSAYSQDLAPSCDEVKAPDQDELKAVAGVFYLKEKIYTGKAKDCYDNGNTWYVAKYKDGLADGQWMMYREDGTAEYAIAFAKGVKNGKMISFNKEGILEASVEFVNDVRNGEYAQFFPNGQAAIVGHFENDINHGPIKTYYENGALNSEGEYDKGRPAGIWKIYTDPSGFEYMTGGYKDGLPHGEWTVYQGGNLNRTETYEGGKLVRTKYEAPPPEEIVEERGQRPLKVSIGDKPETNEVVQSEIMEFPDVEAEFIGGMPALQKFIFENIVYPTEAIDLGEQGKVYLSFIVEKDGKLSNVTVEKGVSESLNAEAVRLLESMPNWKPGEAHGKKVRTKCMMPINFVLSDGNDEGEEESKKKKRRK